MAKPLRRLASSEEGTLATTDAGAGGGPVPDGHQPHGVGAAAIADGDHEQVGDLGAVGHPGEGQAEPPAREVAHPPRDREYWHLQLPIPPIGRLLARLW